MVFSDDDDLLAQWWEEEDDSDDDDFYIAAAVILAIEHESTIMKRRGSVSEHQVARDMPSGNLCTVTNKRPRTENSTPSSEKIVLEEADSSNSQTPDSSPLSRKKISIGRKEAKEKMCGGEAEPYKEALQELIAVKKKERKLKEERWQETKSLLERKLKLEEDKLMWEREQWIMFCDVSTMGPEQKAHVLAMRAQIVSQKKSLFNKSFGGASSAFGGGSGGI